MPPLQFWNDLHGNTDSFMAKLCDNDTPIDDIKAHLSLTLGEPAKNSFKPTL